MLGCCQVGHRTCFKDLIRNPEAWMESNSKCHERDWFASGQAVILGTGVVSVHFPVLPTIISLPKAIELISNQL